MHRPVTADLARFRQLPPDLAAVIAQVDTDDTDAAKPADTLGVRSTSGLGTAARRPRLESSKQPLVWQLARRAPEGDIPTLDWQGDPVDCTRCEHGAAQTQLGCEPGHSCMQDVYARRIDRFFRAHPELAVEHLAHPYFEVRAIAARHVDVFHLTALRTDPDETVRMQVALRLPQRLLLTLCDDPHREVRIRVAQRLDDELLPRMAHDADYQVRSIVAQRIAEALLPPMVHDADEQVRCVVAERLAMPTLLRLASDASARVRCIVARRVPGPLLQSLAADPDWSVRWQVAHRADPLSQAALLRSLAQDADPEVSREASQRLSDAGRKPLAVIRHG